MKRRTILGGVVTLAAPFCTRAQSKAPTARRMAVIGYLMPRAGRASLDDIFFDRLRELGYVEGTSLRVEYRWAANTDDMPALAADLVRSAVDVIVSSGYQANKAARDATTTIPIVMATSGDAVGEGLVASFARPGGNVTGLSVFNRELSGKRLEVLRDALPGLRKVGALFNRLNPVMMPRFDEAEAAGRLLGIEVLRLDVSLPTGVERAFTEAAKAGAGAIVVLSDSATIINRSEIGAAAVKVRLPTMFANRDYLQGGGLMSYGPNLSDNFRDTATLVDRILKGAHPSDLPVEQPRRVELVVNMKAATALGLVLPQSFLVRVDDFIR